MKKFTQLLLLSLTLVGVMGCTVSRLSDATFEGAELDLSTKNRGDLEKIEEKVESPKAKEAVEKVALKVVKGNTDGITARPELVVKDEVAHKAATSGMRNSRRLMKFQPVRTTAYHHDENDHLGYGNKTASGENLSYGDTRSAAADWSRYPLWTRFRIIGEFDTCEYVVDDYGSALVGTNTIDLYKPSMREMKKWGVRDVVIEVLEWGSFEQSREIMSGRTKWKHVNHMVRSIDDNDLIRFDSEPILSMTVKKDEIDSEVEVVREVAQQTQAEVNEEITPTQ
jgi:3D (Asp-Asp-Asp) domain-containing protein